jgi:S-DNA-T family DNA segregation ATPase FtsK/SpoIIIE
MPAHRHTLVVGATRAGKGSVVWSVIAQRAKVVRSGLVKVSLIDAKQGRNSPLADPLRRFRHATARPGAARAGSPVCSTTPSP